MYIDKMNKSKQCTLIKHEQKSKQCTLIKQEQEIKQYALKTWTKLNKE